MKPAKSSQTLTQRTLLNSGLLLGGKNVPNADKFEKFEMLKERFKNYRENVLKIGFENLLKNHPFNASSCTNLYHHQHFHNQIHQQYTTATASFRVGETNPTKPGDVEFGSLPRKPVSSLNLNQIPAQGYSNCQCSFCAYCAQQQTILNEIAYLNNLEHDIKEIRDYLRDTRKKLEAKELKIKLASDWKQIALVLDRTFFFIYLFITLTTLIVYYYEIYKSQKVITTSDSGAH